MHGETLQVEGQILRFISRYLEGNSGHTEVTLLTSVGLEFLQNLLKPKSVHLTSCIILAIKLPALEVVSICFLWVK